MSYNSRNKAFWMVNKTLTKVVGVEAAVFLADLMAKREYFMNRGQLQPDGSFFNTSDDIKDDTGFSETTRRRLTKILKKFGLVTVRKRGMPSKNYYWIHFDSLNEILNAVTSSHETATSDISELSSQLSQKRDQQRAQNNDTNNNKPNNNKEGERGESSSSSSFSREEPKKNEEDLNLLAEQIVKLENVSTGTLNRFEQNARLGLLSKLKASQGLSPKQTALFESIVAKGRSSQPYEVEPIKPEEMLDRSKLIHHDESEPIYHHEFDDLLKEDSTE